MKKLLTTTAVIAAFASQSAFAGVAINFGMGDMYSSTNTSTPFNSGGLINLLSLDTGTWAGLGNLNTLFSNLTNGFTPAGVTLVGKIGNDNSGGPGSTGGVFNFDYAGSFNAGDQFMLVAYPTLTTNSASPGLGTTGFFFRTDLVVDGSDIAYVAPADGATYSLFSYTTGAGGTFANNQFTSGAGAAGGNGFTTVPEPSTYALLAMSGLALGGYIIRRRSRA
jgi:hypothetical protein